MMMNVLPIDGCFFANFNIYLNLSCILYLILIIIYSVFPDF